MVSALKQLYGFIYTPKQEAFIHLVLRYKKKLSRAAAAEKLRIIHSWRPEARRAAKERMRSLVFNKNPLLALMPKSGGWSGGYYPVPISSDTDESR